MWVVVSQRQTRLRPFFEKPSIGNKGRAQLLRLLDTNVVQVGCDRRLQPLGSGERDDEQHQRARDAAAAGVLALVAAVFASQKLRNRRDAERLATA